MQQSFINFVRDYLIESKRSQADIDAEREHKKEIERRKKANREATTPKQQTLEQRPTVRPIAVPAPADGDMTKHKEDNASHPFWDGHILHRQSDGSLKKSSTNIFEGLNMKHIKYTDAHTGHDLIEGIKIPAYHMVSNFSVGNGSYRNMAFRQHFMARLHNYNESGTPIVPDRFNVSIQKFKHVLHSIPKELHIQNVSGYSNPDGVVLHSKSTGIYMPVSFNERQNTINLNSIITNKKETDPKKTVVIESVTVDEWDSYRNLPIVEVS